MSFTFRPTPNLTQQVSLLILLLAFFLRLYQLDRQSLRGDEAASVLYSALPVTDLWELSRVTDPHPPLYYLMLHPWQWLAGESAWAMRFTGVIGSTLTVAALYALARRTLLASGVDLLATALLAINPLQIWLAQDIRSYPFFALLGLLSSWALWQALSRSQKSVVGSQSYTQHALRITHHLPRFTPWFLYLLTTLAGFYIHYYTAFLIAFQGLFVLFNWRHLRAQRWPWLASQVTLALLMIPGLQLAYNFAGEAAGGIDKITTPDLLRLAFTSLLTGFTLTDSWGIWVSLLLAPLWLIGIIALLRRDFTSGNFWVLFFAVPVLGVIALSIDRPFFKERFLVQAQPAFDLLLAVGFLSLWRMALNSSRNTQQSAASPWDATRFTPYFLRFISVLLLAFLLWVNLLAFTNYLTDPTYAKAPPWQRYHNYVSGHARHGDVMLTNFPEAAVSYYSPNELPFYVIPAERDQPVKSRLEQTEQIANAYQRIWFLPLLRQGFDEQGDVLNWLDRHADRVNQIFFPDYNLNLYLSPPTLDTSLISQAVTFAHGPQLRGYQIFDKDGDSRLTRLSPSSSTGGEEGGYLLTLKPEDSFVLSLYWLSAGPTDASYTVFVHLIAADGFNRAGQDNLPVWGSYPTTAWQSGEKITDKYTLTIPAGTPPGDHRLRVGWYNSTTQERVPVIDSSGHSRDDFATLNVIIRVKTVEN